MKQFTDHDLLLRIDERQQIIKAKVASIEESLDGVVKNCDEDYQEMKNKVDSMWDSKNKMIGWFLGSGIAGGMASTLIGDLVKSVYAMLK